MTKKFGYDQSKCDALKRDRKNLTNKIYRRQVKNSTLSNSDGREKVQQDIDKLRYQVAVLNTQIWKCSEQYQELKRTERNVKKKIYRRQKKLETLKPGTKEAQSIKSEIGELKSKTSSLSSKIFRGSDKYGNMRVNFNRLKRKKSYRQRKLAEYDDKEMYEKYLNEYLDQKLSRKIAVQRAKKKVKSDKINLTKENSKLAREIDKLKEALDMEIVEYEVPDFKNIRFRMDDDEETEIYSRPIFLWESQWDFLISKGIYINIFIQDAEFNYPDQQIQMQYAINEAYAEYSEYASAVNVTMTANNQSKTLTLYFEVIEIR
jgi:chromosome segregation ATPase